MNPTTPDTRTTASDITAIAGGLLPFNWADAGRCAGEIADRASKLVGRINTFAKRHPVATGGALLGAAIAGFAGWRMTSRNLPATASRTAASTRATKRRAAAANTPAKPARARRTRSSRAQPKAQAATH